MAAKLNVKISLNYDNDHNFHPTLPPPYGLGPDNLYPLDFNRVGPKIVSQAMSGWFSAWGRKIDDFNGDKRGAFGFEGDSIFPTLHSIRGMALSSHPSGDPNGYNDNLITEMELVQDLDPEFEGQVFLIGLRLSNAELAIMLHPKKQGGKLNRSYLFHDVMVPFPYNAVYPGRKNVLTPRLSAPHTYNVCQVSVALEVSSGFTEDYAIMGVIVTINNKSALEDCSGQRSFFGSDQEITKPPFQYLLDHYLASIAKEVAVSDTDGIWGISLKKNKLRPNTLRELERRLENERFIRNTPDPKEDSNPDKELSVQEQAAKLKPSVWQEAVQNHFRLSWPEVEKTVQEKILLDEGGIVIGRAGRVVLSGQADEMHGPNNGKLPYEPNGYRWALNFGGLYLLEKDGKLYFPFDVVDLSQWRDIVSRGKASHRFSVEEAQMHLDQWIAFYEYEKTILETLAFSFDMARNA